MLLRSTFRNSGHAARSMCSSGIGEDLNTSVRHHDAQGAALGDAGIDEALDPLLVTDASKVCAVALGTFPATFRAAASSTSEITTVALARPKRSAMARPTPLPAPATDGLNLALEFCGHATTPGGLSMVPTGRVTPSRAGIRGSAVMCPGLHHKNR